jgi:hypothetical protein
MRKLLFAIKFNLLLLFTIIVLAFTLQSCLDDTNKSGNITDPSQYVLNANYQFRVNSSLSYKNYVLANLSNNNTYSFLQSGFISFNRNVLFFDNSVSPYDYVYYDSSKLVLFDTLAITLDDNKKYYAYLQMKENYIADATCLTSWKEDSTFTVSWKAPDSAYNAQIKYYLYTSDGYTTSIQTIDVNGKTSYTFSPSAVNGLSNYDFVRLYLTCSKTGTIQANFDFGSSFSGQTVLQKDIAIVH